MAGDFDGDIGSFCPPEWAPHLKPILDIARSLRTNRKQGLVVNMAGKPDLHATIAAMADGYGNKIGQVISTAMRLTELNKLSDELAAKATVLGQGCIDAKKHPIDLVAARTLEQELQSQLPAMAETFTSVAQEVKRVIGEEEKRQAWDRLVGFCKARSGIDALAGRVLALDSLGSRGELLRGSRQRLPEPLLELARSELLKDYDYEEAISITRTLMERVVDLMRQRPGNFDEAMRETIDLLEEGYRDGHIPACVLIAYGSPRIVARMLTIEDLKRYAFQTKTARVAFKDDLTEGEYDVSDLTPVGNEKGKWNWLVAGVDRVSLTGITTKNGISLADVTVTTREIDATEEDVDIFA
jgi:hypothetical protein